MITLKDPGRGSYKGFGLLNRESPETIPEPSWTEQITMCLSPASVTNPSQVAHVIYIYI